MKVVLSTLLTATLLSQLTTVESAKNSKWKKSKKVAESASIQTEDLNPNDLWSYGGCYQEVPDLVLSQIQEVGDPANTVVDCINLCESAGYYLAGVGNGDSCYCGNVINPQAPVASPSDCNVPCSGDKDHVCGGDNYVSLYQKQGNPGNTPAIRTENFRDWTYDGCYYKPYDTYPLSAVKVSNRLTMSVNACLNYCESKGYNHAALYSSSHCYCDNEINWGNLGRSLPSDECNYACPGEQATQVCGGANSFNIYQRESNA